jgi:thioredoxin-related protein
VKKFLNTMVTLKLNAEVPKENAKIKEKFEVTGFPRLLAVTPKGDVVGVIGGYVPPADFESNMTSENWNRYVNAANAQPQDMKVMAENLFVLATWFPESKYGLEARDIAAKNEGNPDFKAKWDEMAANTARESLYAKADALLKMGKKNDAKEAYKELAEKHAGTKEGDEAVKMCSKLGVKLGTPPAK